MLGITGYGGFLVSSILLNMTPGVDTIYILSRSAVGGRRRGMASALGIATGILIHTVLAALGLSAALAGSLALFTAVKCLGAGYLIIMGIRAIISKSSPLSPGGGDCGDSILRTYRQGVLTNALNPKVALFFLALLPQFVSSDNSHGPLPFLLLGLSFCATNTVWSMIIVFGASLVSGLLNKSERVRRAADRVSGAIYIALGVKVLM